MNENLSPERPRALKHPRINTTNYCTFDTALLSYAALSITIVDYMSPSIQMKQGMNYCILYGKIPVPSPFYSPSPPHVLRLAMLQRA